MRNRLADTQSPYLLQHKDNPVAWWPWSEEAFEAAQAQDKPVFLSIGYSTCHWCHVMAHESFEDAEVARLMNEAFINIKVDREERPDIDNIYMTVCQMMTGHGGWPLTVLMTPKKEPFFAGTYIPKHTRHGRVGMLDFVPRVAQAWEEKRENIEASASEIVEILNNAASQPVSGRQLDIDYLHVAYAQLARGFDAQHGGFGTAPKFPSPHNLLFLLRYWKRTGEEEALHMVESTLGKMRLGGIYDHLGYGFHRYSTDATWKLPHFEKMLYDQAMLAMAYTEAFQVTRKEQYRNVAKEIFTYVLRDMTDSAGGFYSAEDADSEGREGTFYVWTEDEIREVLDDDLATLVIESYNLEAAGNFEEEATRQKTGENVLFMRKPIAELASDLNMEAEALSAQLDEARTQLFTHREDREYPGKDDKVLTDWNGLMIAAMAKAARAFNTPAYCDAARHAALFVLDVLRDKKGRLLHRWRNGDAAVTGNLDDYAFFIWGLIELYESSFEIQFLEHALDLNEKLLAHFWDHEHGAFFFAPDDGEALIVRQKESHDGAIPSGNAIAMMNMLRLSRFTGDTTLEQRAHELGAYFATRVAQQPSGFTALLMALGFALGPSYEIVITGDEKAAATRAMLEALWTRYEPNKVVLLRTPEVARALARIAPYTEAQEAIDHQTTAYVCQHFQCERPVTDVDAFMDLLG